MLDPALIVGAPRGLTLATGLDSLSHALESIWNVNANPVSANFAVEAAREIIETLPRLLDNLGDVELRTRQARGQPARRLRVLARPRRRWRTTSPMTSR